MVDVFVKCNTCNYGDPEDFYCPNNGGCPMNDAPQICSVCGNEYCWFCGGRIKSEKGENKNGTELAQV